MPDILDGSVNWMEDCWYLTDPSEKNMKYSRKKSRKNSNDPCEILEGITNFVGDMKEARGLDIVNRVTHIRRTRAMYAEGMGCPEDAINQLGRWITDMIN